MRERIREIRSNNPPGVCDWEKEGLRFRSHQEPTTLVAIMCPECDVFVVRELCDKCVADKILPGINNPEKTYACAYCKAQGLKANQVWKVVGKT